MWENGSCFKLPYSDRHMTNRDKTSAAGRDEVRISCNREIVFPNVGTELLIFFS